MKTVLSIVLLGVFAVQLSEAYFSGAFKPVVLNSVNGVKHDITAKILASDSKNSKLADFMASAVEDEYYERYQRFELRVTDYERRTAEANALLEKATEKLRNPPMEKINYAALAAEDIIEILPKVQEMTKLAHTALEEAKEIAKHFDWNSVTGAVQSRVLDLESKGMIRDIATGGANQIINNVQSIATSLTPSNAISISLLQNIAQSIVDSVGNLATTLTEVAATNLLLLVGPLQESLGNLYNQIVFAIQHTFPFIFDSSKRMGRTF